MWELYAFWTWLPYFVAASVAASGPRNPETVEILSFVVVGAAGATGAVLAGWFADAVGRTAVTALAMGLSGLCCLLNPFLFGEKMAVLLPFLTAARRTPHWWPCNSPLVRFGLDGAVLWHCLSRGRR